MQILGYKRYFDNSGIGRIIKEFLYTILIFPRNPFSKRDLISSPALFLVVGTLTL
jgi:hypothetical protein